MSYNNFYNPIQYNPYMNNFNPLQSRYSVLEQQKKEIESQMNQIQGQMNNVPPIQQTFQLAPQTEQSNNNSNNKTFDFNGVFVNGIDEANNVANNTLPMMIMDKENPIFYMKEVDGSMSAYKFEKIDLQELKSNNQDTTKVLEERMNKMEENISTLVAYLQGNTQQNKEIVDTNTEKTFESSNGLKKNDMNDKVEKKSINELRKK